MTTEADGPDRGDRPPYPLVFEVVPEGNLIWLMGDDWRPVLRGVDGMDPVVPKDTEP